MNVLHRMDQEAMLARLKAKCVIFFHEEAATPSGYILDRIALLLR